MKTVLLGVLASVICFFLGGLSAISSMPKAVVIPAGSYTLSTDEISDLETSASNFARIADGLTSAPELNNQLCPLGTQMLGMLPELAEVHFQQTENVKKSIATIKETCATSNLTNPTSSN